MRWFTDWLIVWITVINYMIKVCSFNLKCKRLFNWYEGKVSFEVVQDLFVHPSKEVYQTYTKDSPDELKPKQDQSK